MGFNTTVVMYNDAFDQIEKDPEFGKKLVAAALSLSRKDGPIDIPSGNHCNAAIVVETHHADQTTIVAVGGNLGQVIAELYQWRFESKEDIFKMLALSLGYSIRKTKK